MIKVKLGLCVYVSLRLKFYGEYIYFYFLIPKFKLFMKFKKFEKHTGINLTEYTTFGLGILKRFSSVIEVQFDMTKLVRTWLVISIVLQAFHKHFNHTRKPLRNSGNETLSILIKNAEISTESFVVWFLTCFLI